MMKVYYGDIHNHCGISYAHGPLADALTNAREQLDFCSVTGHAHWPDMPNEPGRLDGLVKYHRDGFEKLARNWENVKREINGANESDRFVTFLSFEIHSCRSGDHTVYYRDGHGDILYPLSIEHLREQMRELGRQGIAMMANPHHIGYRSGWRGINWEDYTSEFAPVVEMMSMHGCSETDESPLPYLHTMGPCDAGSTMQHGLAAGHVFGVVGSTDHHSAHPGSHGHGRMAVWAEELTRKSIWKAIQARRTYALTGDRIELDFRINSTCMGSVIEAPTRKRSIHIAVRGGGAIDSVELLCNNRTILRRSAHEELPATSIGDAIHAKLLLQLGWGERGETTAWDVRFGIEDGEILAVEPRFRGAEVLAPTSDEPDQYAFSTCRRIDDHSVRVQTRTTANPTTNTNATQGVCLEVRMPRSAGVHVDLGNGTVIRYALEDLIDGSRTGYVGGLVTPAYRLARAVLPHEFEWTIDHEDTAGPDSTDAARDWYYVRVRQRNGQCAWSSPIWVGK